MQRKASITSLTVLLLCVLVAHPMGSASAELIDLGNITRDPATDLDWLDLTETLGLSFDQTEASDLVTADRWRHATGAELCALLVTYANAPDPCPGSATATVFPAGTIDELQELLGITFAPQANVFSTIGLYSDGNRIDGVGRGQLINNDEVPLDGIIVTDNGHPADVGGPIGHYLVRPSGFAAATPEGVDVVAEPVDVTTETTPVTVTFTKVTEAGTTTLRTRNDGPEPPFGFQRCTDPAHFEVNTTARTEGAVIVNIHYNPVDCLDEEELGLFYSWSDKPQQYVQVISQVIRVLNDEATVVVGKLRSFFSLFERRFIAVDVDVKPDDDLNSINIGSAGVIPVAILSTADFDALQVDPESVSLAGARVKLVGRGSRYLYHAADVNDDGFDDLLCQVETAGFVIEEGESLAVLEGETFDGQVVRGEDTIRIVP